VGGKVQINTLNRIISLFLVGGLALLALVFFREGQIRAILSGNAISPGSGPAMAIVLTVGLLSLTALVGAIVDALGNLTVRRLIRGILSRKLLFARAFFGTAEFREFNQWRRVFREALNASQRHQTLSGREELVDSFAASLFFDTAEGGHSEWFTQHHSIYYLASNFVVVLSLSALYASVYNTYAVAGWSLAGAYLLTTFALDKYLYTYQMAFRSAYLALGKELGSNLEYSAPNTGLKRTADAAA
jgi:hypothetical protein